MRLFCISRKPCQHKLIATIFFVAFASFILSASSFARSENLSNSSNISVNLLQSGDEVLKPFIWLNSELDNSDEGFQKQLDYGDPNRITMMLFREWLQNHDVALMSSRLDAMIKNWSLDEPDGHLYYKFGYGKLPAGWRSGMDSWAFPALLIGLWQETGKQRYKQLADKLIQYTARDVAQGGTVWRDSSGCWFSEYAWDGMQQADEYYVLNGHLLSLEAVKLIADATGDVSMAKLYHCGVQGTKLRSKKFLVENKWALYMLGPKTVNQTHYLIYEIKLFDALAALDDDPFFRQQAAIRRRLLRRHFPVYGRHVKGKNYLTLSTIGAPHPYLLDTYPLYLECTDGNKSETYALPEPTSTRIPLAQAAMLNVVTHLSLKQTSCKIEAVYAGKRLELYTAPVKFINGVSRPGARHRYASESILDAYTQGKKIIIDPARRVSEKGSPESYLDTQGRLILTPKHPIRLESDQLIGLDFDADGALAIGVVITSKGRDFFRYYPKTRAGKHTLVLLSPLGFDGGEDIVSVDKMTVYFYTDKQPKPVTISSAPRLISFSNQAQLYEYFRRVSPNFYTE